MESKKWYTSKGVLGGLAVLVGTACTFLGHDLPISEIENVLGLVFQTVGAVVAIYGRVKAQKTVSI